MGERSDRRRSLPWLVACLLLAAAAWLLLADDGTAPGPAALDDTVSPRDERAPDLLTARGEPATPTAPGPALVGRAQDPADAPARGPVRVTVLGAGDHPLVNVVVETVASAEAPRRGVARSEQAPTDRDGVVVFADLPYDGTVSVRIRPSKAQHNTWTFVRGEKGVVSVRLGSVPLAVKTITGPEVVLRTDLGIPLHVGVLAADSGRRVRGASWRAEPGFAMDPHADWEGTEHGQALAVKHGQDVRIELDVGDLPADLLLHGGTKWKVRVHPAARRLAARVPLRPEARVYVTFDEPEGVPAGVTWRPRATFGMTKLKGLTAGSDAYGRWRLRGVPHLPGEPIQVGGTYGDWGLTAAGRLPLDAREPLHLHARLLPLHRRTFLKRLEPTRAFQEAAVIVSGRYSVQGVFSSGRIKLDFAKVVARGLTPRGKSQLRAIRVPPEPPRFDVRVLGFDGEPVRGAQVTMHPPGKQKQEPATKPTSKTGVARFEGLAPGAYGLRVWGAGAPFGLEVVVPEGGAGGVTVRAEPGGTVHVFVVDEEGEPMPFATLAVEQPSKLPWCDVDPDGEQRIDPFTDHLGRRILRNVEAGVVKITAKLGSCSGAATVTVPSGGAKHAHIVLERPGAGSSEAKAGNK